MSTTNTSAIKLNKPGFADRNWHLALNQNADWLDAQSALAKLCVTPAEVPSASRNVSIAAGTYRKADGTSGTYAGTASYAVPASQTSYLYLDSAGNLASSTSSFPSTACVPLAIVSAGTSTILSITDARTQCAMIGTGSLPFLPLAGGTLTEGAAIAVGSVSGAKIGTSTSQKIGFWNATPVAQPGPYTQVYTTADRTISAYTSNVQSTAYTGAATGLGGTPYAQAADLNTLRAAYENLRAYAEDIGQALNALIDDLQAIGIVR